MASEQQSAGSLQRETCWPLSITFCTVTISCTLVVVPIQVDDRAEGQPDLEIDIEVCEPEALHAGEACHA